MQPIQITIIKEFRLVVLFYQRNTDDSLMTTMLRCNYQSGIHVWINQNDK